MKHMWSEEELQELIPKGGSSLEDIVDKNGNKRFIEGNGTPATITGLTSAYCKWSLSGTHLMIVFAGNFIGGYSAGSTLASYKIPEWIFNKIYPIIDNIVERKDLYWFSADSVHIGSFNLEKKLNNTFDIKTVSQGSFDNLSYFRIQFDLIIDSE